MNDEQVNSERNGEDAQNVLRQSGERRFRVVSPSVEFVEYPESEIEVPLSQDNANSTNSDVGTLPLTVASETSLTPEEEDSDDSFFAKSFALNAKRNESTNDADAFAGGLRSLFESEDDESDGDESGFSSDEELSDEERFQRDVDSERRESLDGVLSQNDADFLSEAGDKYERSPESNVLTDDLDVFSTELGGKTLSSVVRPESILEAMLFVGDKDNKPLLLSRACELMRNVSELEAIEALADLNERYLRDRAPYKIVRDGDGFRLKLREEFSDILAQFGGKTREFKLSQTAIDVLALIAYRQPISFDEILEVRNNASSVLNQLVKRELIAQEKQMVEKRKVSFYKTTDRFLRVFNLESLDDLPIVGDVDYR